MIIPLQYGVFVIFVKNHRFSKHWNVAQSLGSHLRDKATDESGFNSRQWQEISLFYKNVQTLSGDELSAKFLMGSLRQNVQVL